jgi:5'(3')-deoxyribonucleotidase
MLLRSKEVNLSHRRQWLIDVDGVVADLMSGFEVFFLERHGTVLRHWESDRHRIARSTAHRELHERFDLDRQLTDYLSIPDVYQRYIPPISGSQRVITRMIELDDDVRFVTAILHKAPSSFASKLEWFEEHFPGIPMMTADSHSKHWVVGDYAIDDRFDTCSRWEASGTKALLFQQPWNEAPEGTPRYRWEDIAHVVG